MGINFLSSIPIEYKRNLIGCLINRAYNICSNYVNVTSELNHLRKYFLSNNNDIYNDFVNDEHIQTAKQDQTNNTQHIYSALICLGYEPLYINRALSVYKVYIFCVIYYTKTDWLHNLLSYTSSFTSPSK